MRIHLEYYGWLADTLGQRKETRQTRAATAGALLAELAAEHRLAPDRTRSFRVAINDAFAEMDTTLAEGDLVVFIPPVSGG